MIFFNDFISNTEEDDEDEKLDSEQVVHLYRYLYIDLAEEGGAILSQVDRSMSGKRMLCWGELGRS